MKTNDWNALIEQWETLLEPQFSVLNKEAIDYGILTTNISSVRRAGCNKEQIHSVERRLGVSLPNSYKEFLRHTNGANTIERPLLLLSADDLDWYKNIDPKNNIQIWEQDLTSASDEKYFVYLSLIHI